MHPVKVREGIVFQGRWSDAQGKRCRRHLSTSKLEAQQILTKIVRERDLELAGMSSERGLSMSLEDVAAIYLAELSHRAKPRAVKETAAILERIRVGTGAKLVRDLTRPTLARWRHERLAQGMSHKTANNHVAALAAALNHALRMGQIPANPIAGFRGLPTTAQHQKRKPRALSEDEIGRLLDAAIRADQVKIRGRYGRPGYRLPFPRAPLVKALLSTGARWGELVATSWLDLDLERSLLTLRAETTKTAVERAIPLERAFLAELLALKLEARRITGKPCTPSSRIFLSPEGQPWGDASSFRKHLHALYISAGIEHRDERGRVVHVHALRHTFATRLARAGIPVQVAQLLTGHRTAQVLMSVYTHLRVEDARGAIERLPALCGEHLRTQA